MSRMATLLPFHNCWRPHVKWGSLLGMGSVPLSTMQQLLQPQTLHAPQHQTNTAPVVIYIAHTFHHRTLLLALAPPCYTQVTEPHTSILVLAFLRMATILRHDEHNLWHFKFRGVFTCSEWSVYRWAASVTKLKRHGRVRQNKSSLFLH